MGFKAVAVVVVGSKLVRRCGGGSIEAEMNADIIPEGSLLKYALKDPKP